MTILRDQEESLQSTIGSRALVSALNKENRDLKQNIVKTQNELEGWRTKYHDADKDNTVLTTKMDSFVGAEIAKFGLSAVGISWGVNLASSGNILGLIPIIVCSGIYLSITWWQRKK